MLKRFRIGLLAAAVACLSVVSITAHGAALSNYAQNKILDQLFRGQAFTFPTTFYFGLDTSAGSASACGTEVSGGSYARVAVTLSLANFAGTQGSGTTSASSGTSGQTSNNNAITFPAPTANWGTIVGGCIFDASSGGNMIVYFALTVSKTVNSGDAAPSYAAAAFTYTLTQLMERLIEQSNAVHLARVVPMPAANHEWIDRRYVAA